MSAFLVEPERFPAVLDGEPFGDERLSFRIAGHALAVEGLSPAQSAWVGSRWERFAAENPEEDAIAVAVRRAPAESFRDFDRRGREYVLDFEHGRAETRLAGYDLVARVTWSPSLQGELATSAEEGEAFRGAFENFVRVLLAHATLAAGGVLLHSASVLEDGRVRLFVGPSGAGKSTVARLALGSGREVASDDLNPVVPTGDVFHACGSPFLGDVGALRNEAYPLAGIYRLEKGETDSLRPMGPAETLSVLVATSPFVNRSPFLGDRLWSNVEALARSVPSYVLTFRREGTFWSVLERS